MTQPDTVTACLIIIGNEILSGRTQDANAAFLATALNEVGVRLREVRIIPDIEAAIIETVNAVRPRFDYVFTTGGIGPTHDDITAASIARAFGLDLVLDEEARGRLDAAYRARGLELNEARLRMARVPRGAVLIDNPISAAPGFQIGNVFVLAGVPSVARAMFASLRSRLAGASPLVSRTIGCRLSEGQIAQALSEIQDSAPAVEIGSYPSWTDQGPQLSLVLASSDRGALERAFAEVAAMVRTFGNEPVEL
jgi:molybdenum cofactor synthesis domain-containing protein